MSTRRRASLASLLQSNSIDIIQTRTFDYQSILGLSSAYYSFLTSPKAGNKVLVFVSAQAIRNSNLVGGTLILLGNSNGGGTFPGRTFSTTDLSNSYQVQNTSTGSGNFLVILVEVSGVGSFSGINSNYISAAPSITSSTTSVSEGERLIVFTHIASSNPLDLTTPNNSFIQVGPNERGRLFSRLYTSAELNQVTTITLSNPTDTRQHTIKLLKP